MQVTHVLAPPVQARIAGGQQVEARLVRGQASGVGPLAGGRLLDRLLLGIHRLLQILELRVERILAGLQQAVDLGLVLMDHGARHRVGQRRGFRRSGRPGGHGQHARAVEIAHRQAFLQHRVRVQELSGRAGDVRGRARFGDDRLLRRQHDEVVLQQLGGLQCHVEVL